MCFSAAASFSAGVVLEGLGAAALKKAKSPDQWLFAGVPVLFGLQQLSEGMLWLSFNKPEFVTWQVPMTYVFLFFAQVLWTAWIPMSIFMMERSRRHRGFLAFLSFIGIGTSIFMAYRLIVFKVTAQPDCSHIFYDIQSPESWVTLCSILYLITTIIPPLASSKKSIKWLGVVLVISLLVSKLFFAKYLISVWCFFSAILSGMIVYILKTQEEDARQHSHMIHE